MLLFFGFIMNFIFNNPKNQVSIQNLWMFCIEILLYQDGIKQGDLEVLIESFGACIQIPGLHQHLPLQLTRAESEVYPQPLRKIVSRINLIGSQNNQGSLQVSML